MHQHSLPLLCGVFLLLSLIGPGTCAVTPLWIEPATVGGELSGVIISPDDSTIVAGGDQLICLTREGQKRWGGWSGTSLDISSDGDYLITSKGQVVRLISSAGTLIWEQSMDLEITEVSMAPDASLIAAAGGGKIRTISISGEAIASNTTMSVNDIKVMPAGKQILVSTTKDVQLLNRQLLPNWSDTNVTHDLLAVAPDGSFFVTATYNRVRMYTGNGTFVWETKIPHGSAKALAYSRDGSTIVVGMDDHNVHVLNRNGAQLWTANASNWVSSVAVSGDGNTIVAGSMDKKVSVYNHAGARLGTFSAKSAIKFNSVAVTTDGSLIVVVDESAVYGLSRSSFIEQATITETTTEPIPETPDETIPTTGPRTTTRKVSTRPTTLPTPYPTESVTPEAALPPAVPLGAVLILAFLLFCRSGKN